MMEQEDYSGSVCLLHKLTKKFPGYVDILVDVEDFGDLAAFEWLVVCVGSDRGMRVWRQGIKHYLHRVVTNAPSDKLVDHRNHRPLDNRKRNLRVCTFSQNNRNARQKAKGTSPYRGVSWQASTGKWLAQAGGPDRRVYLGLHHNEVDAARAYNEYAKRVYGEFACLNPV